MKPFRISRERFEIVHDDYGWIVGDKGTPEVRERIRQIRADLASAFAAEKGHVLVNVNAN